MVTVDSSRYPVPWTPTDALSNALIDNAIRRREHSATLKRFPASRSILSNYLASPCR